MCASGNPMVTDGGIQARQLDGHGFPSVRQKSPDLAGPRSWEALHRPLLPQLVQFLCYIPNFTPDLTQLVKSVLPLLLQSR